MLFNDYEKNQLQLTLYSIIMQSKSKGFSLLLSQSDGGQCLQAVKDPGRWNRP